VRIRDDGKGVDPRHLSTGRAGHWGLTTMRERAVQIGGQLNVWSQIGAGTEVELRIPGAVAYGGKERRRGLFGRRQRRQGAES
jgi:nitrate/nitrite-specific signal transduction histidine kinase